MLRVLVRDVLWAKAQVLILGDYHARAAWRYVRACDKAGEIALPDELARRARGHYKVSECREPPREADLDGMLHRDGDPDACPSGCTDTCGRCQGRLHRQPVYNGFLEVCETCPEDAHYWYPAGHYRVDGLGIVVAK